MIMRIYREGSLLLNFLKLVSFLFISLTVHNTQNINSIRSTLQNRDFSQILIQVLPGPGDRNRPSENPRFVQISFVLKWICIPFGGVQYSYYRSIRYFTNLDWFRDVFIIDLRVQNLGLSSGYKPSLYWCLVPLKCIGSKGILRKWNLRDFLTFRMVFHSSLLPR